MPRTHRLSPHRKRGPASGALLIGFLCGLASAANASADSGPRAILAEAESAFARGTNTEDQAKARAEFARAAALYAQIQARNPALCLNEGNAQLLAGVVPQAILA